MALPGVLGNILTGKFLSLDLIVLLSLVYVIYLINKTEKQAPSNTGLTQSETIQIIITEILNPIVAGAFYYYTLKSQFPKKAGQANLYSWIVAVIESVVIIVLIQQGLIKS